MHHDVGLVFFWDDGCIYVSSLPDYLAILPYHERSRFC